MKSPCKHSPCPLLSHAPLLPTTPLHYKTYTSSNSNSGTTFSHSPSKNLNKYTSSQKYHRNAYKIKPPLAASDFRPISVVPILSRILERIVVTNYIYPAISAPPMVNLVADQFAFRPTGSTTAALIDLL